MRYQLLKTLAVLCAIFFCIDQAEAATPLLKIKTQNKSYIGKEIIHNDSQCWLMNRDGKMTTFAFSQVTGFKQLASTFKPYSAAEMRSHLMLEFQNKMEVVGTAHYLICAAPGQGKKYGQLFEQLYRESYVYFSTRGFKLKKTEFPLVAIIFPTHAQFVKYANAEGITNTKGLGGYYQTKSNRIALFAPSTSTRTAKAKTSSELHLTPFGKVSATSKSLQETIIHEGTHQIAFNLGLHSRIAETPRWIVEGLATVFEHPESRKASKSGTPSERINRERFLWFGNYVKKRRVSNSLESFIASDHSFQSQTLDAYSQAWAFSFFLMETRSSQYAKYLKRVASRPMLGAYSSEERLQDFHKSFGTSEGNKMKMFEAEFLRFISRL